MESYIKTGRKFLTLAMIMASLTWILTIIVVTLYEIPLWLRLLNYCAGYSVYRAWRSFFRIDFEELGKES